ncbi:MAG: chorismate mutase, partial [Hyphomicrobiales bacterium]
MTRQQNNARTLDDIRAEIDQIDDELHELIVRRTALARDVWNAKGGGVHDEALAVLRPAREAAMLARLARRHRGDMPLATLWRIWRAFIIANIRVQAPFDVFVGGNGASSECWDLARGHFGFETGMHQLPSADEAIAAARAGVGVAVLPMTDIGTCARRLVECGLPVFAALPQIGPLEAAPRALVVGDVSLEATGNDVTMAMLAISGAKVEDTIVAGGEDHRVIGKYDAPGKADSCIVALAGFAAATGKAPVRQSWR